MRIIIVSRLNPFFENSAAANRLRSHLSGLSNLSVNILMIYTGGYSSLEEFKLLRASGTFQNIKYRYINLIFNNNLWLKRINIYFLYPLTKTLNYFRITRILKTYKDSILWTSSDLDNFELVVKLKRINPNQKAFLELNEFLDIHDFNKGNALQKRIATKRQLFFEKKAYKVYDGLALITNTLIKHYLQFPQPGPKLLHLPMTVDLDRFTNSKSLTDGFNKPYIAFIGVMNDVKDGVNILIEAFAQISQEFPNYKLYLVGGRNYDTPIHQRLIKKLEMEEKIFWKGEFNRNQIPSIIMNASLLALPRPDSKQAQGGFPTKLGEYLASGIPVCSTTVGEIPDYLIDGESVFFAKPKSVESFAEAMLRALRNPVDAKRIGLNGRKIAETHFNKDIQAESLYKFLQSL